MKTKVFVDGEAGTTGLEIRERLALRSDIEVMHIDPARRKDPAARAECLNAADVAFLCLPDDAARESAALVKNPRTCVIDASTAHRSDPNWAYGVVELAPSYRAAVRTGKRIANPGCHATGFVLAIRPLVQRGIIPPDFVLSCFSLTGYSGGGKKMIAAYNQSPLPASLQSPRPYALGLRHKHLPEMTAHTGLTTAPVFVPVVGNFYRGMLLTIPLALRQLPARLQPAELHRILAETYAGEKFVRVLPFADDSILDGESFDIQACNGTNRCDIAVFANEDRVALMARLDNLGKGASGAAIQCMNLHLGLDEGVGLKAE